MLVKNVEHQNLNYLRELAEKKLFVKMNRILNRVSITITFQANLLETLMAKQISSNFEILEFFPEEGILRAATEEMQIQKGDMEEYIGVSPLDTSGPIGALVCDSKVTLSGSGLNTLCKGMYADYFLAPNGEMTDDVEVITNNIIRMFLTYLMNSAMDEVGMYSPVTTDWIEKNIYSTVLPASGYAIRRVYKRDGSGSEVRFVNTNESKLETDFSTLAHNSDIETDDIRVEITRAASIKDLLLFQLIMDSSFVIDSRDLVVLVGNSRDYLNADDKFWEDRYQSLMREVGKNVNIYWKFINVPSGALLRFTVDMPITMDASTAVTSSKNKEAAMALFGNLFTLINSAKQTYMYYKES